jgi:hypothetical protein
MEVTKESWDAVVKGQLDDLRRINDLQARLCRMAKQVEKLSYLLQKGVEWYIEPEYGITLEEMEDMWNERGGYPL